MTIIIVYITKERGVDMYYRNDEYILSAFYCNDGETEKNICMTSDWCSLS